MMKDMPRDRGRPQKRERDGDEAEEERAGQYRAVQEEEEDNVTMGYVKSINKLTFEMHQKARANI